MPELPLTPRRFGAQDLSYLLRSMAQVGGDLVAIPIAQQRRLLQRSGNLCAFPDCRLLLTTPGTPTDPVVVLGEIAHIVAESPHGPRGASPLTPEQRNLYPNLILLCNQHHQLIDSDGAVATYTVERLTAMKEDHEKWVERTPARANQCRR